MIQNLKYSTDSTSNQWFDFEYTIENQFIVDTHIDDSLNLLWNEIENKFTNEHYLQIFFKINLDNDVFRSVSYLVTIKKDDFNDLNSSFKLCWNIRGDDYQQYSITKIIYTYRIVDKSLIITSEDSSKRLYKVKHTYNFNGITRLPDSMDFALWGDSKRIKNKSIAIITKNSTTKYIVKIFEGYNLIELKFNNILIVSFKDSIIEASKLNKNSFIRTIFNSKG
jgi:hypothetical protein